MKKSSGYSFVFSSVDVDTQKHISISVQDGNIDDVVRQILAGQIGITYEIKDKNIIIKKSENGVVSSKKLQTKGSVRDVNGEPIIGATVMERGTSNGTITDIDGNFMLEVARRSYARHFVCRVQEPKCTSAFRETNSY